MARGPCATNPCSWCKRHKRYKLLMANGSRARLRALLREVYEELNNVEAEIEMANVVLDGSWPTAVEQLEDALKIAKEKRAACTSQ